MSQMTGNGAHDPVAEPRREDAPVLPVASVVTSHFEHYQSRPDGGMTLIVTPTWPSREGDGYVLVPPQLRIVFDKDGWERFQREVAADGVRSSIAVSREIPPLPPPG